MSGYLDHLPIIFQEDPFLGRFLLAFERILTGRMGTPTGLEGVAPGIEEVLDRIHRFFDPGGSATATTASQTAAPDAFLPWLASWVAISLRDDWSAARRRTFIQQAASLYRQRGTPAGLAQMVSLYTDCPVQVIEPDEEAGGAPHYFQVVVSVMDDSQTLEQVEDNARFIIEQEKPAHTWYGLLVQTPAFVFQIVNDADASRQGLAVGRTTVLGVALDTTPTGDDTDSDSGSVAMAGMRIKNHIDTFNRGLRVGRTTRVQGNE